MRASIFLITEYFEMTKDDVFTRFWEEEYNNHINKCIKKLKMDGFYGTDTKENNNE